jgi:hypothetical protein
MILVPRPSGGSPEVVQPAKYTGGEIRMARLEPELSKPGDLGIFFMGSPAKSSLLGLFSHGKSVKNPCLTFGGISMKKLPSGYESSHSVPQLHWMVFKIC